MTNRIFWSDFYKSASMQSTANAATQPAVPIVVGKYGGRNNPFNMRNYFQGWLGEAISGLKRGDMLNFSSPYYGWRAGSRNARNILLKLKAQGKSPTIRNFTQIYSPKNGDFMKNENNVSKHMKNISDLSMIGLDDKIDPDNDTQFFKFITSLAMAESGSKGLAGMSQNGILKAMKEGRKSVKK